MVDCLTCGLQQVPANFSRSVEHDVASFAEARCSPGTCIICEGAAERRNCIVGTVRQACRGGAGGQCVLSYADASETQKKVIHDKLLRTCVSCLAKKFPGDPSITGEFQCLQSDALQEALQLADATGGDIDDPDSDVEHTGEVTVKQLDGEQWTIDVASSDTLLEVQKRIAQKARIPAQGQLLLFEKQDLNAMARKVHGVATTGKETAEDHLAIAQKVTWGALKIPCSGAQLMMLVKMHSASLGDHVSGQANLQFDMAWDDVRANGDRRIIVPSMCFLQYSGGATEVVWDGNKCGPNMCVRKMDRTIGLGEVTTSFVVSLGEVPRGVSSLFFIFSTPVRYFCDFSNVRLSLRDRDSLKLLSKVHLPYMSGTPNVAQLMCCAKRSSDGRHWEIVEIKKQSHGSISHRVRNTDELEILTKTLDQEMQF